MSVKKTNSRLYRYIVDTLTDAPKYRAALIDLCIKKCALSDEEMNDNSPESKKNRLRGELGNIINEMHASSLIGMDNAGKYYLASERPAVIRIEKCQKEIINALTASPLTKSELYRKLSVKFGTDKTITSKDDGLLTSYIGQLLKKMNSDGLVVFNGGYYSLAPKVSAKADDINAILALKSEFIARIHSKGGEFFENYFMRLIKKFCEKHEKKVLECYVTGGSADGGIDGVIKTEDLLGFRETVMVQTKNRVELVTETDARGFYGAVCAKRGTRGIFVTTSDFHPGATAFLNSLDDCIGINGDRIFSMAVECSVGIKKSGKELLIDEKTFL